MYQKTKWLLASAGALIAVYSVAVLVFVVTTPDVRLRCLVVESTDPGEPPLPGVLITALMGTEFNGPEHPRIEVGDRLVRMNDEPIRTFMDFTRGMNRLRNAQIPPGGWVPTNADLFENEQAGYDRLPSLAEEMDVGRRWVEIQYIPADTTDGTTLTNWVLVQSLPMSELILSFVWFLLYLGLFLVGALAFWKRPFDRSFRLFFALCIVTLGAYVGGYHWGVISSNLWLNVPFVVCAMLVPVVLLHFFLVFPKAKPAVVRHPWLTVTALYAVPVISIGGVLATLGYLDWIYDLDGLDENLIDARIAEANTVLRLLIGMVYLYFGVAAFYFVATWITLALSYARSRNPVERGPLRWLLGAGLISAVLVSYTLYLALFQPGDFAIGAARVPMFLASLLFLVAFVVGIVRYRLMLVDQVVSRSMWYYLFSYGLTAVFCLLVATGTLFPRLLNISLSAQQTFAVAAVLMVSVLLLLWIRDRIQQMVDRRFFREKYQLDKALKRMNRAVGHLSDPEAVAHMMLGSCRDVLRVEQAALYLRTSSDEPFQLIASDGAEKVPLQLKTSDETIKALSDGGSVQRVTPDTRRDMSSLQTLLRELFAGLIHTLEVEWGVAGLVVLGEKNNGAPFTAEDLTFLNALGQITNVAFHSARVDQEIGRLNEELQARLEKIADQKRQIAILQAEVASRPADEATRAKTAESGKFHRGGIKGDSPAIVRVLHTVRKVATSESSVLIRGESGTGKELLAQVLHDNSPRNSGPMIAVHGASLSPTLLESELFGHVKGAFTGAERDKVGRFEMANGGTLFLDEIGDISLETQVKLLRVLQERKFEPVGGTRTIQVDVRLVTATHQDLERLIADSRFREDLYYRLNVISITLPPLRERLEDIYELAFHFLRKSTERTGKRITDIDRRAFAVLERHLWPGNIRELENVIERAVVLAEDSKITLKDLPAEFSAAGGPRYALETKPAGRPALAVPEGDADQVDWSRHMDPASERALLEATLAECQGNKAEAARRLGLPRSTYYSKLKKFAID